jgi:hypothetical protein
MDGDIFLYKGKGKGGNVSLKYKRCPRRKAPVLMDNADMFKIRGTASSQNAMSYSRNNGTE